MITRIKNILENNNIAHYLINDITKHSAELFYIKKDLDLFRKTSTRKLKLTVYNDFTDNGNNMRGDSSIILTPDMTDEELKSAILHAYTAASYVKNPYYPLPAYDTAASEPARSDSLTGASNGTLSDDSGSSISDDSGSSLSDASSNSLLDAAKTLANALYSVDTRENVFINSAEIFAIEENHRIINSENIDVTYTKHEYSGEFVTQCQQPQDVETYQYFNYNTLNTEALKTKVTNALDMSADRAQTSTSPKGGKYRVIISGSYLKEIFSFYVNRANAAYIYAGYSTYETNKLIQNDNIYGISLSITLKSSIPYSNEGIPMSDTTLIDHGLLTNIHGNSRFCHYLNKKATGIYTEYYVEPGNISMNEMLSEPCLHIVNFSDFQMNALTGYFGGEIRLAYLYQNGKKIPVTGGSINGSLIELQNSYQFSSDTQTDDGYEGPLAICFKEVNVAGE